VLLGMSLSGLFGAISGMGGMTACNDAICTARSSGACINLVAIGGEADKAGRRAVIGRSRLTRCRSRQR
jgi:hypothetical protein